MPAAPLLDFSDLPLPLLRRGKVRDVFEVDADHLLMVTSDRISAFDFVLGSGIPDKGKVLTQVSAFWFDMFGDEVAHHLVSMDTMDFPASVQPYADRLRGRTMLVRRTTPLPVECVARGYLEGSGWKDYQATGGICGIPLPPGLVQCARLPRAIFTPASKAESGHDENITAAAAAALVGATRLAQLEDLTLALYERGARHAASRGILVADTKFEFGVVGDGPDAPLMLIDEVLTPDSSRFWPADVYEAGRPQRSFDKQYVREYLEQIRWNKQPPVPSLPADVVARTRAKYVDAFTRLTGRDLA